MYEYDPAASTISLCTNSRGHQVGDWGIRLYYDVHHTGGGVYFLAASSARFLTHGKVKAFEWIGLEPPETGYHFESIAGRGKWTLKVLP
jgi:hypothetical protein